MRYEKGRKETTRQRILEVASLRFRRDGVSSTGIAGIMAEAGLTNGAFYPHFDSKESLVREALACVLRTQHAKLKETIEAGGIEAAVRSYLSLKHLKSLETGCPSAALVPEIGRAGMQTRTTYVNELQNYVATLAEHLPGSDSIDAHQRAMALFSLMVGTLQIARAAPKPAIASNILEGGIASALILIKQISKPAVHEETQANNG